MSVIINASNTTGLTMTSDLSGQLQFQNNGVNLPMGGVAPAFSATCSAGTSLPTATYTKLAFDTKVFDTATCFSTVNNRFTPNVAGYYMFTATVAMGGATDEIQVAIYKNGSNFKSVWGTGNNSSLVMCNVSAIIQFNGTTDYIELYGWLAAGGTGQPPRDRRSERRRARGDRDAFGFRSDQDVFHVLDDLVAVLVGRGEIFEVAGGAGDVHDREDQHGVVRGERPAGFADDDGFGDASGLAGFLDGVHDVGGDRKSTRLNSSHTDISRMPSSA